MIENLMFGHNCIVITKTRPSYQQFKKLPYRFAHKVKDYQE